MSIFSQFAGMDKSVLSVTSLGDESDERAFWLSKTPRERLAAMEFLRAVNYGYDPASSRLQRVLAVAQLGTR
ncbi:MAG: hypothetical protein L6306_11500 [Planctomycetales bacterium]|nr:hypothetical protein [Planctomycetales bacterium]